jgi:hypothetical protein
MALTKSTYRMLDGDIANVNDYGADPTGIADSTAAFTAALSASRNVYIPNGTYLISQITISQNGTQIVTGDVVIKQKPNVQSQFSVTGSGSTSGNYDFSIIVIKASNVTIGDISFEGNIATDTGEFNHCIYVIDEGGALSEIRDIKLGSYYGTDIRGDVLYVGGTASTPIYSLRADTVDGDNIYRSIVSITGGNGVSINNVLGNRAGYRNIDFEPNAGSQQIENCYIGYVRGGMIQCASDSASVRNGVIHIDRADLDSSFMPNPTPAPPYATVGGPDIAIILSRFDYLKIGSLKMNNYNTLGIIISTIGAEQKGRLVIDYLEADNIATVTPTYQTVIESSGATSVEVNSGLVTLESTNTFLKGLDADYSIRNISFTGGIGLANFCNDLYCENVTANVSGNLFGNINNGQVINSTLVAGTNVMNQCKDMSFYNCVVTYSGAFDNSAAAGSDGANFDRGTLNSVFYDHYTTIDAANYFPLQGSLKGSGTPEGAVTATIGTSFLRTDGGAGTTFYIKESGTGNTGWVAK